MTLLKPTSSVEFLIGHTTVIHDISDSNNFNHRIRTRNHVGKWFAYNRIATLDTEYGKFAATTDYWRFVFPEVFQIVAGVPIADVPKATKEHLNNFHTKINPRKG